MSNSSTSNEQNDIQLTAENPWLGLSSFKESNADFFFGRDHEIEDISRLVRQETLTVLIGKSGLGKSSILRAGISPRLREDNFVPVYIRLNHQEETLPLEDQVEVAMEEAMEASDIYAPKPIRAETLWEYFHKIDSDWWGQDNQLLTPVLIFDQLEELLTAGQENALRVQRCFNFLAELEDLIENRPPKALKERFRTEKGLAKNYDLQRINYRVLLSFREDYLADLETLTERMRPILMNRYRLLPLSEGQAKDIILKPGGDLVDEAISEKIIGIISPERNLSAVGSEASFNSSQRLEPALLSVILRELNSQRIAAGENRISADLVTQTRSDQILSEFYQSGIQGLGSDASEFIEQHLLTASGARNRIVEEDAIERYGLSKSVIEKLVERRVLQRDQMANATWIELSHDCLTAVVSLHAENRRRRRRLKRVSRNAGIAVVLILAVSIFGLRYKEEQRESQLANEGMLAIEMINRMEGDSTTSMSDKQSNIDAWLDRFSELEAIDRNSKILALLRAEFLVTTADIQLDHGYDKRALESARAADDLLFSENLSSEITDKLSLLRLKAKLVLAEAIARQPDYLEVDQELEWAEEFLSGATEKNSGVSLDLLNTRFLRLKGLAAFQGAKPVEAQQYFKEAAETGLIALAEHQNKLRTTDTSLDSGDEEYSDYIDPVRNLYSELFKVYQKELSLADRFALSDFTAIYEASSELLNNAEQYFVENSERLEYFSAVVRYIQANKLNVGLEPTSHAAHDEAIEKSIDLIRESPDNIKYRNLLFDALIDRAWLDNVRDTQQAKWDISAVANLTSSILRDSGNDRNARSLYADILEHGQLSQFENEEEPDAEKVASLLDEQEESYGLTPELLHAKIIFNMNRFYEVSKSPELLEAEAFAVYDDAMEALSALKAAGADEYALSFYETRINTHMFYKASELFTDEHKLESITSTVSNYENLLSHSNSYSLIVGATWAYTSLGYHHFQNGNYADAVEPFHMAINTGIEGKNNNTSHATVFQNSLYAIRHLMESHIQLGDWESALDSSRLAAELFDPDSDSVLGMDADTIGQWQGYHTVLENTLDTLAATSDIANEGLINDFEEQEAGSLATIEALKMAGDDHPLVLNARKIDLASLSLADQIENSQKQAGVIGWSGPPAFASPGSYTVVGDQLDAYDSLTDSIGIILRARITPLSFYENGRLLTLESFAKNNLQTTYFIELDVENEKQFFRLNGTSPPIHEVNARAPVELETSEQAADYLRFFCLFVQGDEGAFKIVENVDEITWAHGSHSETKETVRNDLRPLMIWPSDEPDNKWKAMATVNYSNALFYADFRVLETGMIEMNDDLPIYGDLPIDSFLINKNDSQLNFLKFTYIGFLDPKKLESMFEEIYSLVDENDETISAGLRLEKLVVDATEKAHQTLEDESPESDPGFSREDWLMQTEEQVDQAFDHFERLKDKKILDLLEDNSRAHIGIAHFLLSIVDKQAAIFSETGDQGHCLNLTWYLLYAEEYDSAKAQSAACIENFPDYLPLKGNYAHALALLDEETEAMAVYEEYIGEPMAGSTWEEVYLDDFDRLEKAGITHPTMAKFKEIAEAALNTESAPAQ